MLLISKSPGAKWSWSWHHWRNHTRLQRGSWHSALPVLAFCQRLTKITSMELGLDHTCHWLALLIMPWFHNRTLFISHSYLGKNTTIIWWLPKGNLDKTQLEESKIQRVDLWKWESVQLLRKENTWLGLPNDSSVFHRSSSALTHTQIILTSHHLVHCDPLDYW